MSGLVVQRIRLRWTSRDAAATLRGRLDLFRAARWTRDRDDRAHLYGGPPPGRR
ncbi:hypothetical protein MRQ36_23190 [Micromonospora sp. R77]|uniref:hypothetical protein n=1 Tax=Micromonospora sp. R77 TaxID=2925836 RepID=UPI001F61E556|nr:hypothetical protein [Micromonospora sp. R77]MCI4065315.1 hypothetical protein [Micromonospora sp. R77]